MLKSIFFRLLAVAMVLGSLTSAQAQVKSLSSDPGIFVQELHAQLTKAGMGDNAKEAATQISALWNSGQMSDEEKETFIGHVNILLSKGYRVNWSVMDYVLAYSAIKNESSFVKIPVSQFFEVSQQCILEIEEARLRNYLQHLTNFLAEGYLTQRAIFFWRAFQPTPELLYISLKENKKSYSAPVIRFQNTELNYVSAKDSTKIYGTSGDYNLISGAFLGVGGSITWEKMGLPSDQVYVVLDAYRCNFNYGGLEADSVTFYYKGLIDQPLKGRFEDKNLGYRDRNKANFPMFKSYEGGVVIENFVPDVRYEGGFSLRGIRKIGSSYDKWVELELPEGEESYYSSPYDDPVYVKESLDEMYDEFGVSSFESEESYDDTYYDDYYDEESAETDDDSYDDIESTDYSDEGEEGYFDENDPYSGLPDMSKVRKHVKATLEIKRGEIYVMKLLGEEFILDPEKMVGKDLEANVYLADNDSLYHPSMDLLYSVAKREVVLKKPKRSQLGRLPFVSSFHEFYLYFESISWNLDSDELHFTAFIDQENKLAAIESFSFFAKYRFDQFKGVLKFNPIGAIYRFAVTHPGISIFPTKILEEYDLMEQQTAFTRMLPLLEGSGFIRFDRKSMEIFPQPKLFDWAQFAREKQDFDAIQLTSRVDTGSYSVMSVDSKEMELRGCQFFSLSDSQYLRVVPLDSRVIVKKNRTLQFGGAVAAGKLNFYGNRPKSFTFDYESFKILGDSLDSMKFVMVRNPPMDYVMSPLEKALRNTIFENVSGAIHIDAPRNKSGMKDFPEFPVFDSYSSAYVYWDRNDIQKGIYHRDSLYFSLDPFVLDSLEDFNEKNLIFDGEFFSSEIFPKFRQSLVVMGDYTLGFREISPPNGYYIYNNKGLYYKDIFLDGSGLHGNGEIEVLDIDLQVKSDSFVFHFDSVMALVYDFHRDRGFRSGSYYPEVDARTALFTWYTKQQRVVLQSLDEPIRIFRGEGDFEGELTIRPEGMTGKGAITLGQIRIESDSIVFNEMDFSTPEADFIVIDKEDPDLYHFVAEDVNVSYDVYDHISTFQTKTVGKSLAYFPIHQYRTSLAKGTYARETNDLKLEGISSYIKDNFFLSTAPEQDSLKFNAKESYYKIDTRSIEVSGVPYIYVADATITPDRLEVTIEESGLIKKLENAIVEADQETKLHRIYEAGINIFSANQYEGSGKYDYIDIKDKKQFILFDNIRVNSDTTTIASGGIPEAQQFYLTERILFKGQAAMDASRKFLEFEGEVKIESENAAFKGNWFDFRRSVVNPDSVFIPIKERITNRNGELLTVGLNYSTDGRFFYSNFLQTIRDESDLTIMSATGGLTFDRRTKEFRIGSREKITGRSYRGATVSLNDSENTITSQGLLNFPSDFPKNTVTFKVSGSWKDDLRNRQLSSDLMMCVDFPVIPDEPFKKLYDNLLYMTTTNRDVDFNQRSLLEHVSELLDEGKTGDKETLKFIQEVKNSMVTSDIKLSKLLPYTLVLSHVDFNYSREYKALYCDSEIGLIGMNEEPINKMIPAKIVYTLGRPGREDERVPDRLDIYLEVDEFNWLFFSYQGEVVKVTSSYYDDFNYPLQAEVDKRKKSEGFRFEMSNEDEVNLFRQDFVKKFIIR